MPRRTNKQLASKEAKILKQMVKDGQYLQAEQRLYGLSRRVFDVLNNRESCDKIVLKIEEYKSQKYSEYRNKMKYNTQDTGSVIFSPLRNQINPYYEVN